MRILTILAVLLFISCDPDSPEPVIDCYASLTFNGECYTLENDCPPISDNAADPKLKGVNIPTLKCDRSDFFRVQLFLKWIDFPNSVHSSSFKINGIETDQEMELNIIEETNAFIEGTAKTTDDNGPQIEVSFKISKQ